MSEEAKYYTPEIDEFHVGFECEFKNSMQSNEWEHEICDQDTVSLAYVAIEHEDYEGEFANTFRVKHLDKSDIESFGFKQKTSISYVKEGCRIHCWENNLLEINDDSGEHMCTATVKNKSELKKLLKMIGI